MSFQNAVPLTPRQAAEALGVSYATIKHYIYQRKIKTTRTPGGHHRIDPAELERVREQGQQDALLGEGGYIYILVVEDVPDTQDYLKLALEQIGYVAAIVEDGVKALHFLVEHNPDLIITDVRLRDMGGIELIREVRRNPELDNIPILAMSAFFNGKDPIGYKRDALEAGANGAIGKPFLPEKLEEQVRNLLGAEQQPAATSG